jgi:hypothetical protein
MRSAGILVLALLLACTRDEQTFATLPAASAATPAAPEGTGTDGASESDSAPEPRAELPAGRFEERGREAGITFRMSFLPGEQGEK